MLVGFILDHIGPRQTYAPLAGIASVPAIVLLLFPRLLPVHRRHEVEQAGRRSVQDLLANHDM